jgi:DNA-binding GntR family transcriptional regulator
MALAESRPLSRTFLVSQAYDALLDLILSGALPSGTPLSEVDLARRLGVSRTPVHLALVQLAREGLVEQAPGRRPLIARFGRQDVVEIYEMRMLLETAAVERAAEHLDPAALAALIAEADALAAGDPSLPSWSRKALEFDVRFHDQLASAGGNRRLREEIAKVRLLVRAFCRLTGSPETLQAALAEHQAVLKALKARHPGIACQAMARHIQNRLDAVLDKLFPEAS